MNYYVIIGPDGSPLTDLDTGQEFQFRTRAEAEVFTALSCAAGHDAFRANRVPT